MAELGFNQYAQTGLSRLSEKILHSLPGVFRGLYHRDAQEAVSLLHHYQLRPAAIPLIDPAESRVHGGLLEIFRSLEKHNLSAAFIRQPEAEWMAQIPGKTAGLCILSVSPQRTAPYSFFVISAATETGLLPAPALAARTARRLAVSLERDSMIATRKSFQGRDRMQRLEKMKMENLRLQNLIRTRDVSISRLVHDIRLPLSGLHLALESMNGAHGSGANSSSGMIGKIQKQVSLMERLTHDILQVDTGRLPGEKSEKILLLEEIHRVLDLFSELIQRKKIEVKVQNSQNWTIAVNRSSLERILCNLVSNSLKFCSSPGKLFITCEFFNACVCMEFEDTGPGLNSSQETVFELCSSNIGRGGGGWGIGLASARNLAQSMGGRLTSIQPKFGKGANFLLVLPTGGEII